MKVGDKVKFLDGLYEDEEGAEYIIIEDNGDRVLIQYVSDMPFPPVSVAYKDELEKIDKS